MSEQEYMALRDQITTAITTLNAEADRLVNRGNQATDEEITSLIATLDQVSDFERQLRSLEFGYACRAWTAADWAGFRLGGFYDH